MTQALDVDVNDFFQSEDASPQSRGQFELPQNSTALLKVEVFVMRDSDRVTRGWTLEALVKRNGGAAVVQEVIPSPPNIFGAAADVTALSTVTVAAFSDATNFGITCTGLAGSVLSWSLRIAGRTISL